MKCPASTRRSVGWLHAWRRWRVWLFISIVLSLYLLDLSGLLWFARLGRLVVFFVVAVGAFAALRTPTSRRWFNSRPHRDQRVARAQYPDERFEINLPCSACKAPNIGVEAVLWADNHGRPSWCRTCEACGATHWWGSWGDAVLPPLVRLGSRRKSLSDICGRCGYTLAGTPVKRDERSSDKVVLSRQCPECGRVEQVAMDKDAT